MFTQKYVAEFTVGKLIVCGRKLELKQYSSCFKCGSRKYSITKCYKKDYVKRTDNLSRTRQNVRRIVWTNITPHSKFLTLTTADVVLDVNIFKRRFTTFLQAMKREGYHLRYLGVLERQIARGKKEGNEGSIHAHLIIFNDEFIPFEVINKHWNGYTDIHVLNGLKFNSDEKIIDIGAYVCKYITKEACTEWGSHSYFTSKGLKRPVEINDIIYYPAEPTSSKDYKCLGFNEDNRAFIHDMLHNSINTYNDCSNHSFIDNGIYKDIQIHYSQFTLNENLGE